MPKASTSSSFEAFASRLSPPGCRQAEYSRVPSILRAWFPSSGQSKDASHLHIRPRVAGFRTFCFSRHVVGLDTLLTPKGGRVSLYRPVC